MPGQQFIDSFLTLTFYKIPSSLVLSPKRGQYSRSVSTGSSFLHIIFSFFIEIVSTYYLPHFWEVTAQIVPPDSIFRNTKPLHVWSAFTKSSATCRKEICLIHSQMKSRSNALFLSGSSLDALKRHILAFREVKHLFSQLWNSPFKRHLVDQFLERYTYPG